MTTLTIRPPQFVKTENVKCYTAQRKIIKKKENLKILDWR